MGYGVHEEFESRNRDKKSVSCVYTSNRRLIDKRINEERRAYIRCHKCQESQVSLRNVRVFSRTTCNTILQQVAYTTIIVTILFQT